MNEIQQHAQDALGRLQQSKYVNPYDTSEATPAPAQVVPPPVQAASNVPIPQVPVDQSAQGPVNVNVLPPGNQRIVAGPANVNSDFYVPHTPFNPVEMANSAADNNQATVNNLTQHTEDKQQALTDAEKFAAQGAQQKSDVYQQGVDELQASQEREQAAQQMHEQDTQKIFAEKQAVVSEMTDMYSNQPKDLWGRAGVNKVSGIIGLFLGALSRTGRNPAMDALNTLVEQNLTQQKFQYQMLGDRVKGYDTAYGQLRQKLGDEKSAELAFRQVSLQQMQGRLASVEQMTLSKQGKANLQGAKADLSLKLDETKNQIFQHSAQQTAQAAQIASQTRGQDLTHAEVMLHEGNARSGAEGDLPGEINGLDAPVKSGLRLSKAATDKAREEQQGVREVHDTVEDIKSKLKSGGLNSDLEKSQAEAALKLAIVKAHNLSRRVGGDEGKLIEQDAGKLSLGLTGWVTKQISPQVVIRLMDSLDKSTERAFVKGLVTNGYTVTKGGMYDHSSKASPTGQSDEDILQNIPLRGEDTSSSDQKKMSLPDFNQ